MILIVEMTNQEAQESEETQKDAKVVPKVEDLVLLARTMIDENQDPTDQMIEKNLLVIVGNGLNRKLRMIHLNHSRIEEIEMLSQEEVMKCAKELSEKNSQVLGQRPV